MSLKRRIQALLGRVARSNIYAHGHGLSRLLNNRNTGKHPNYDRTGFINISLFIN
jgi:hypothetical protein